MLAAEGPKNVALAAEVADGWIAMLLSPHEDFDAQALAEGFAREGARRDAETFETLTAVPFLAHRDVEAAVDMVRPYYALYFGGMGARGGRNFHCDKSSHTTPSSATGRVPTHATAPRVPAQPSSS